MRIRQLFLTAAAAGLCGVLAMPAAAVAVPADVDGPNTLVVDDDGLGSIASCDHKARIHRTIAAALEAARDGDTIIVCPGVYGEDISVTKRVKIRGAQAEADPRERVGPESIVTGPVVVTRSGVSIDGLMFDGVAGPAVTSEVPLKLLNNVFRNNCAGARLSSDGSSTTSVTRNVFIANNGPCPESGMGIYAEDRLANAVVEENQFFGHSNADIHFDPPAPATVDGVVVRANQGDRGFCFGRAHNLVVADNAVGPNALPPPEARTGALAAMSQPVIALAGPTGGRSAGRLTTNKTPGDWGHPAIQARQVDPAVGPAPWGVHVAGGASGITITGNTLVGVDYGVLVGMGKVKEPNTSVLVERNCLAGNIVAGLGSEAGAHSGIVVAEQNWWGAGDGPSGGTRAGTGDVIADPDNLVDADPFLLASTGQTCPLRALLAAPRDVPAAAPPVPADAPKGGVAAGAGGEADDDMIGQATVRWGLPLLVLSIISAILVVRILREGPRRRPRPT